MRGFKAYDSRGNMVQKLFESEPWETCFETTCAYNRHNLKTEEEGGRSDGNYHYHRTNSWGETDNYENWLKVTEYYDGECKQVTTREIEYY
jgi:hypothetical protein